MEQIDDLIEKQRVTALKRGRNVNETAARAAAAVGQQGGSPRAQLEAARAASSQKLRYLPHQSTREMQRRQKQMARGLLKTG